MSNDTKEKKPAPVREAQKFIETAKDFEKSKVDEIKSSRKLAWLITGASVVLTLLAFISLMIVIFRHQEVKPQVLVMDKLNGSVTLLQSLDENSKALMTEVNDKYWLGQYVKYREGYDWWTIAQSFDAVKLMTADNIFGSYDKEVKAPDAPLNSCKDKCRVEIKIGSITFMQNIAQVRWTKQRLSTNGENIDTSPLENYVSVIAFKYDTDKLLTDQQRLVNGPAFTTLSYRKDSEVSK